MAPESEKSSAVDLLILGAGWTSNFLVPLCQNRGVSYALTSRSGRSGTIKFEFNQELIVDARAGDNGTSPKANGGTLESGGGGGGNAGDEGDHEASNGGGNQKDVGADDHRAIEEDSEGFTRLPKARTVLITFPITKTGAVTRLVRTYTRLHSISEDGDEKVGFIQLGTTSIWDGVAKNHIVAEKRVHQWYDRHSPYTLTDRAASEEELLSSTPRATILNLSGLWGGERDTRHWVGRVAPTKDVLRNKGSIHMIHGNDVARAILAVHADFDKAAGERWLLTDGRVYDWWDLASAWGIAKSRLPTKLTSMANQPQPQPQPRSQSEAQAVDDIRGPQPLWVLELMQETATPALPRDVSQLGRSLSSTEFWATFRLMPERARLDSGDV